MCQQLVKPVARIYFYFFAHKTFDAKAALLAAIQVDCTFFFSALKNHSMRTTILVARVLLLKTILDVFAFLIAKIATRRAVPTAMPIAG